MVIDDHIAARAARAPARQRRCRRRRPRTRHGAGGAGGAFAGQELLAQAGRVRQARIQGRAGRQFPAAQGPHAGRGGRVGVGQDDDGPDAAAPARADRRRGHLRRPEPAEAERPRTPADAPAHPDRVPEPLRQPEPALHHRPDAAGADGHPRHRQGHGRARAARAQPAGKGGPGRPRLRQVPARIQRRPAPARGHRALPDAEPRGAGARRSGERAGRVACRRRC